MSANDGRYGFESKDIAETQAAALRLRYPMNRYEVAPHRVAPTGTPLTWGVKKFVPYIGDSFKLDGFVWFQGVLD